MDIITKQQKYIDEILKSSSAEPLRLGIKRPWVKGIHYFTNKDHLIIQKGDDCFSPFQINVMI